MADERNLFDVSLEKRLQTEAPLATRMRPCDFQEFVGQEHIVGKVLRRLIDQDRLPSIILWGPAGSGKTTLAFVIASVTRSHFNPVSAVSIGVKELREAVEDAKSRLGMYGQRTILFIVTMSNGDARVALNALEMAALAIPLNDKGRRWITVGTVEDTVQHRALLYDKAGEEHYNLISALHKSLRGSDPDAALYWLGRILEAGEHPLYIVRRLVRFASEDIGVADPEALVQANAAQQAVHFLGLPEGNLAIAQAVVYLAQAPKSNSVYRAYSHVQDDVKTTHNVPVPLHLRNTQTPLMRQLGYGRGAHEYAGHFVKQQNLPDELEGRGYYKPSGQGFEKEIARRLKEWWQSPLDLEG